MALNIQATTRCFNTKFLPYLNCQIPLQLFCGGGGSGKSVFIAERTVRDVCQTDRNFLIVRKVAGTLRASFYSEIKKSADFFRVSGNLNFRETDMEVTGPTGNKIYFRGLDDVEKIKSITVPKGVITDVIIEEATEITENDFNQLVIRLRGWCPYVKRITMLFNPVFRSHWICKRFFKGQNIKYLKTDKMLIVHSTYKDNRFLADDDIARIEELKETSPYHYMVYALGEWGVLGDLIFTNWTTEDLTQKLINTDDSRGGLDFGFTNDPTAILRTAISRAKKEIYIFDELHQKGLTNQDIARLGKPVVESLPLFCDSAEPKSIAELRQAGLNAYGAEKGKDSLLYSIQWLQGYKIIIDSNKCPATINEFSMYQWQKDKSGATINQPVGINDHCIAALRYAYSKDRSSGDYIVW